MTHRRMILRAIAAAGLLPGLQTAFAQAATNKVYVGFPPGGLPDIVARGITAGVTQALDGATLVENRPGANGRLAAQAVKAAAPDGRTLLVCPASAMVHLPHVYKDLGYDPFADFVPVAQLVENAFGFAISAKIPVRSMAEWVAWCKQNPDKATFGSPGQGSSPHFMGDQIARALAIPMRHVPYRGNNFALTDVTGGHISGMVSTTGQLEPQHKAGHLRILAVTARARLSELTDVPTFAELSMPQLTLTEGTWVMAPARTPAAVVDKLSSAILALLKSQPQLAASLEVHADLAPLAASALAQRMREDYDTRGAGIRAAGFSL
jgi:tripartite-type tricarboxylate transporter receptor subunit TctC